MFHDGRNRVTLLCDVSVTSGEGDGRHDPGEFWFILTGEYEYRIGSFPPIRAVAGDIVMCPVGLAHAARVVGDEFGLRVSVSPQFGDPSSSGQFPAAETFVPSRRPPNMILTRAADLLARSDERRFTIIENDRNTLFLIRERPGDVSNAHWHFDFDEWWVIGGGELLFEVGEGRPELHARRGDIVFTPRGFRHQITTLGEDASLRMPVTTADNVHIWTDDDAGAPAPRR